MDLYNAGTDVELLFELLMLKFKSKEEIIKYCVEYRQEKLGVKRKKSTQSGQRLCKKCCEPGHYQKTCKNPPKIDTNINSVSEEELGIDSMSTILFEEYCKFVDKEIENDEIYEEVSDNE